MTAKRWMLAHGRHLDLGGRALVMGVLNVTPDSFSDGGRFDTVENALAQARRMVGEGAAIVDVGGESTRPGAEPVTALEEQRRVLPVIEALAAERSCLISVDTYREETARLAVAAGAHIVNDVWGLQREPGHRSPGSRNRRRARHHAHRARAREAAGRDRRPVRVSRTVRLRSPKLPASGATRSCSIRVSASPRMPRKTFELMARFDELHRASACRCMAGTSRKRFIGHVTGRDADARDAGTAATSVILRLKGAALFRVHDVAINVDALAFADAMLEREKPAPEAEPTCISSA